MRKTKLSGGVVDLCESTEPNKEAVKRNLLTENHNGEFDCSQVFLSISRHICGVISSVFLNAITVALRSLSPGRFSLQGCWDISHRNCLLNKSDMHSCSPRIFSNRSGSRELTWPRYFCGLGSKSSTEIDFLLTGFEYSCFSKQASDIRNALSFLFRGGFHWHGRDVHGTGSFSTALPLEARLGAFGFRAESACSKADTCVQLADCLKGAQLMTNANRLITHPAGHSQVAH